MPILYLDSVTDGMLRGLGLQMYSMKYNILDAVISVVLVYLLLPGYAVAGYVFMICFTEVFNFVLSINRLTRVAKLRFSPWDILKSVFCAFGSVNLAAAALRIISLPLTADGLSVALHIAVSAALYVLLLRLFRCCSQSDIAWVKSLIGHGKGAAHKTAPEKDGKPDAGVKITRGAYRGRLSRKFRAGVLSPRQKPF
jgi:stage V sporulation protein B